MGISHMYLDSVYFFVSCFFSLVCSLHILKLRSYMTLLQSHLRPPAVEDYVKVRPLPLRAPSGSDPPAVPPTAPLSSKTT
eukprot:605228-Pyramimonas_sp.AAC.1